MITAALVAALALLLTGATVAYGASVTVVGSTTTVRPLDAPAGTADARLVAARNEFESFQVVVRAGTGSDLSNMSVALVKPLTAADGSSMPAAAVTIYRAAYHEVTQPSDGELGQATGRFPDALIPAVDTYFGERRAAFPVTVPAGENRTAWIDVHVPAGQAPGTYAGELQVTATGFSASVPVRVRVTAVQLPSTSSLRGAFDLNTNRPCQVHGCADSAAGFRLIALYARAALDHRVSIAKPSYVTPTAGTNATLFRTHTRPLFTGTAPTRLAGAQLTDTLVYAWCATCAGAWKAEAAAGGFLDRVTFHCDEVSRSVTAWKACSDAYATASAQWNGTAPASGPLPLEVTATRNELDWARSYTSADGSRPFVAVADAVRVLDPVINRLHDKTGEYAGDQQAGYAEFRKRDPRNRVWAYTSCMSHGCVDDAYRFHSYWNGWPSYAIDQPASQARAMPWLLFARDVQGEYYYETVQRLATAWTDQYSEGGNGDGTLFYPGIPGGRAGMPAIGGTREIPIESIRLKRIREGREDYEYLHYLASNGRRAAALDVVRNVFPSPFQTTATQAQVDAARMQLVAMAEEVAGASGGTTTPGTTTPGTTTPDTTTPGTTTPPGGDGGDGAGPVPTCNGRAATIVGTEGADVLTGTPGNDVIVALGGSDRIDGRGGHDTICAGAGNDVIVARAGHDHVDGGGGADTIDFRQSQRGVRVDLGRRAARGWGRDRLVAIEHVVGSRFADQLSGDARPNRLFGGAGNDVIRGRGGNDLLRGGPGSDVLHGGSGIDQLLGDRGADRLYGGWGDDRLVGGRGRDLLAGGPGRDAFNARDGMRDVVECGTARRALRSDRIDLRRGC